MKTKPLGRPITGNPKAERQRKYFAARYQRLKTEGTMYTHKSKRKRQPDPHKIERRMLEITERLSRMPCHTSSVGWNELSSGRSNS